MSLIDKLVGIRKGWQGNAVRELQEILASLGYPIAVDGYYGPVTAWHVNRVCIDAGVPTSGGLVVTLDTWVALMTTTRRNTETPDPDPEQIKALRAWAFDVSPRLRDMVKDAKRGAAYEGVLRAMATLVMLRHAVVEQHPLEGPAFIAEWLYARDVREEWGQNRGPWVDVLVDLGGGDHRSAPSWCAYFVTACRRIAQWLWSLEDPETAARMRYPVTGRAAALYQRASEGSRFEWREGEYARVRGAAMVRSRTTRPVTDRDIILAGNRIGAHTAPALAWCGPHTCICIGGNSSGSGHDSSTATSRAHARGRVAVEVLDARGQQRNPKAYAAYLRCAGFAHLTLEGDEA